MIILDDAETLIENKRDEQIGKFLDEIKTLMKEDLVKVLILCDNEETKLNAVKIFDQDFTHFNEKKPSDQVNQDFEQYVADFTGLKVEEAKKFVKVFGFNIFEVIKFRDSMNLKEDEGK